MGWTEATTGALLPLPGAIVGSALIPSSIKTMAFYPNSRLALEKSRSIFVVPRSPAHASIGAQIACSLTGQGIVSLGCGREGCLSGQR